MEFAPSYLAFLDILGFADISSKKDEIERIVKIVEDATDKSKIDRHGKGFIPADEIKVTQLSDSILLSIPSATQWGESVKRLRFLLHSVEQIQFLCAVKDVWIRGGVSWGELHHGNNVFGEALVRAYRIEQNARYPRVMLDLSILPRHFIPINGPDTRSELTQDVNKVVGEREYSGKFIYHPEEDHSGGFNGHFQDDGLFVHYMNRVYATRTPDAARSAIAQNLSKRLYESKSPEIFAKYQWVIQYLRTIATATDCQTEFYKKLSTL